jgi:hypothetical protein
MLLFPAASRAGLVSYQSLDSATGLVLNNGAAITTGGQGKFGEAIMMDGVDDFATVTAGSGITGGTVRTVSAWVYQTSGTTGLRTPVSFGTNGNGTKWDLDIDNDNGGIEVGVGGGRNVGTGLTGLTGNWIMVVSTLPVGGGTVGNVKTYLNGVVTNAGTGTRTVSTSGTILYLGVFANPAGQYLNGRVDDVAIWNEALSDDEIKAFYDVGNTPELAYTAKTFDSLKQVHDAGSGSVEVNGLWWKNASGLSGPAGLSGSGSNYTLVLDATAGTGLVSVLPAVVTWGGAGSAGSPEFWDSASNSDPTHWNQATPPEMTGPDDAIINGGGIQKDNSHTFSKGSAMTLNSGAFFRLNNTTNNFNVNSAALIVINDGNFECNTNAATVSGANSVIEVVKGSFVYNAQTIYGFGMNNGATAIVRAGGVLESTTFFNCQNIETPVGATFVIDGGTLLASGAESNPIRAGWGLDGGGFDFTAVGGMIRMDNFTGGDLTAYLTAQATTGFFKINGTTVSGFGSSNAVSGKFLALTDNGTSGSLVLTAVPAGSYASWIGGYNVGGLNGLDDNPDNGRLLNGIEFLLGGDPTVANDKDLPIVNIENDDLVLTFDRHDQSIGFLDVVVEVSTNLANWPVEDQIVIGENTASSGAGVTITDEGASDAVEVRIPRGSHPTKHARIRVSLPQP